jgi:excisionase family DNA binding protein
MLRPEAIPDKALEAETPNGARYLTVEEVAKLLRCSIRSVHARTAAREIPCRRLPSTRRVLFRADELECWIESGGTMPLEFVDGPRGGFVVRPREESAHL